MAPRTSAPGVVDSPLNEGFTGVLSGIDARVRSELSAATRQAHDRDEAVRNGSRRFLLTRENYTVIARGQSSTIPEKIDKLLRLIAERSGSPGKSVPIDPEMEYPLIAAESRAEMVAYVSFLEESRLLAKVHGTNAGFSCVLTIPGWQKAQPTLRSEVVKDRCFVTMSYHPDIDEAYRDGIGPAVRECGFGPRRTDKIDYIGSIADRTLAEIRQARFVIADFTGHRPNVYFEAGFAEGLGTLVIPACRESDKKDLHFDTRHLNHLIWKDPDDLKKRLADSLRATIIDCV